MAILTDILIGLVALLHIYFLILEMFFWAKPRGLRVFGHSAEYAKASATLAANQGLYNGFMTAGLVWGLVHPVPEVGFQIKVFFLSCIIIAGLYGGYTVTKKILFVQAVPAALGLLCLFLA